MSDYRFEQVVNNGLQRTEDWYNDRLGKPTASGLHRLMSDCSRPMTQDELAEEKAAKGRKTTVTDPCILSEGAITYLDECICEYLTGKQAIEIYVNKAMQDGIDREPLAKNLYIIQFKQVLIETGFVKYSDYFGGSPDCLASYDGGLEIKCPTRPVHYKYLKLQTVKELKTTCPEIYWQCIGNMIATYRDWWDFISFNPDYPKNLQLKQLRIERHAVEDDIKRALLKLGLAEAYLKSEIETINKLNNA